jgi:UDP-glucose 4-epimerase
MKLENKVILVTGGAGFVGSNLCAKLNEFSGVRVVSLDNYFTGTVSNHIEGVEYIRGESANIDKLIDFTPDVIFHLGEYSRVEQSFDDIEKVIRFNLIGTSAVLEFVRKTGAKIIYAGSSTKFGDNGDGSDASPYGWSKSSNTNLVKNYGRWYNIDFAITYFYNVFGKNEISEGKYATLIALFANKVKNGMPLTVVKPGTQIRNFTHVDDIVEGLILVAKNGLGDGFGIGNSKSYTILEIAKLFKGKIIMLDERPGNRLTAPLVTEKTESLGWKTKNSLVDYIEKLEI